MVRADLGFVRYLARVSSAMWGVHPRHCPCCDYAGRFRAFGMPPRFDAECPRCGALERHRLFVLACRDLAPLATPRDVLHFAPERALAAHLKPRARTYVTADLSRDDVDRRENVESLTFGGAQFDVVICSHLLEHVDDAKALREIRRVLRPGGLLLCMVPVVEGWERTYENPDVATPLERTLHFGQHDHVRWYGRDIRERLASAGFSIREYTATGEAAVRHGLLAGEKVFVCARDAHAS